MSIIHASLTADIPAYFLKWIINRINEGFFDVRGESLNEIIRTPIRSSDKIIFHTKDSTKLISHIKEISSKISDFEVVTAISMYDKYYHPKAKALDKQINDIKLASKKIGYKNSFCYGPVFKNNNDDLQWHISQFKLLCSSLQHYVHTAYVSFAFNQKCHHKGLNMYSLSNEEKGYFLARCTELALQYGFEFKEQKGIQSLGKDELDIGQVNICPCGCYYCEGISNPNLAKSKYSIHDPASSLLIGTIPFEAKIIEKNKSMDIASFFDLL